MIRLLTALTGLPTALLLPLLAMAQSADCRDDRGQDRCAAESQSRQRAGYGVPPIEELARGKAHVLRVFFVDGYGQEAGLIAALRAPGAEPRVEVYRFRPQGVREATPMAAPLAPGEWQRLIGEARYVDRSIAAAPGPEAQICLHSWLVTVEVADPDGKVRRRTQDACSDGPAVLFGFALARTAVAAIPACGLIKDSTTRNDVTRLASCAGMGGDRAAAAEAWNWLDASPLGGRTPPEGEQRLRYAFGREARFAWPGRPAVQGGEAAAQLWIEQRVRRFWPRALIGEDAMRVRAEGVLALGEREGQPQRPWPHATMVLTRGRGMDFTVQSLTVTAATDD